VLTRNTKFHFDNVYQDNPVQYGCIRMTQIGDIFCRANFEVPEHVQYCHEISLIVAGSGLFTCGAKKYRVKSGDLFYGQKDKTHYIRTSNDHPLRFLYLGFDFDTAHPEYAGYRDIVDFLTGLESPHTVDHFNLHTIFNQAFNEIVQNQSKKDIVIRTCLEQLVIYTYRNFTHHLIPSTESGLNLQVKSDLVYTIINYIDNNILNIRHLTDISGYIGYSYSYASQIFSSIMGISIGQYFQQTRFLKSLELLKSGYNITQTAETLGFDSVHSFSRSFKKFYGVSPRSFASIKET